MSKPQLCVDCSRMAPHAETSYTLIGQGWRASKRETTEGVVVEWRCRDCWRRYKSENSLPHSSEFPAAQASSRSPPRNQ
jgi:hypothetical protein